MKIRIEVDEQTIKDLVVKYLDQQLGELGPTPDKVKIEVKSKQNYRSEWESAAFRAVYEVS